MVKFLSSTIAKVVIAALGGAAVTTAVVVPVYQCIVVPNEHREVYHDYEFKYWNECDSLSKLKEFVKTSVTPGDKDYVPQVDRIATFDMDGTLFGERSSIYIEWMMYKDYFDTRADSSLKEPFTVYISNPYDQTKEPEPKTIDPGYGENGVAKRVESFMANHDVTPPDLEMDEAYAGAHIFSDISIEQYLNYVDSYLDNKSDHFTNLYYKDMFYKPMIEVVEFLQLNNFDVYIVSGTDRYMVRDIVNKHLDIPYQNVIGMDVQLKEEDGVVYRTDRLLVKNVENAKVELIAQEIGKKPILSFGNSGGDVEMNNFTLSNDKYKSQAYMVLADDDVRECCRKNWQEQKQTWENNGYQIFSMKDNWNTIYGKDVTRSK